MTDGDRSEPYGRYRQMGIYTGGMLADRTPTYPVSYEELREAATETLSPEAYTYVAGNAGEERTAERNHSAFDRWGIVPRVLCDVEKRDLSVELYGDELDVPTSTASLSAARTASERW